MEMRKLGSLEVSVVGLGCNNFGTRCDEERSVAVVHAALDAGITLFDTADVYGRGASETFLGRALGRHRPEVVLATKFGAPFDDDPDHRGASGRWIEQAVEASLRRLGTDYIDLFQQHVPDASVPLDETLVALDALVRAGKVREVGNSNFSGAMIEEADGIAQEKGLARFASAQNHLNLLVRDAVTDVLPRCERLGLGVLPYFPLASGMLTGKYRAGEEPPQGTRLALWPSSRRDNLLTESNFHAVERLSAFATRRSRSLLELAFSWLASLPAVASVIAGATSPEQVRNNAQSASWRLGPEELRELEELLRA